MEGEGDGETDGARDGRRIPLLRLPPRRLAGRGRGVYGALLRDPRRTRALGELREGDVAPNFVPLGKAAAAEPQLGERAIV